MTDETLNESLAEAQTREARNRATLVENFRASFRREQLISDRYIRSRCVELAIEYTTKTHCFDKLNPAPVEIASQLYAFITDGNRDGWQPLNINNEIRVRLTDAGKQIWLSENRPYSPDADGWFVEQAWVIMQVFGPHLGMGFDPPFETEIMVRLKEKI